MAKTYTANSYNISVPAGTTVANDKSMLGILNAHATNLVKVWRIWVYPNSTAVTGASMNQFAIRRLTALTAGTAVTAIAHDSANATKDLTSVTIVTGGTATASGIYFDWFMSSDEPAVSSATNDEIYCLYPFALGLDLTGDSNIEPIVLRQNQGLDVQSSLNLTVGNYDIIIEFTVE